MRRFAVIALTAALAGCDSVGGNPDIVARAGVYELRVDRLAQIMAEGKNMPIRQEVAQQVANLWVDYAVLAQAIAEGDPIYDSTVVMASMWRDVQQLLVDHYYNDVIAPVANLTEAQVDSAYNAGEVRYLRHILVRTAPTDPPPVKDQKRERADEVHRRLVNGGDWDALNNEFNDDRSRSDGGTIGLVQRGQTLAPFEEAAYALEPGGISDVTPSPAGFHVIWRPELSEVYDAFKASVEDLLVSDADTTFLADLMEDRRVRVDNSAPETLASVFRNVLASKGSRARLGRYEGGTMRVDEFLRWFEGFTPAQQTQIANLGEEDMKTFVSEVITNQILVEDALANGISLDSADWDFLNSAYIEALDLVRANMNITDESIGDTAQTVGERRRQLELRIDQYLQAIARNERTFVSVPPYLADTLRAGVDWKVYPRGVERVLVRAEELRSVMPQSEVAPGPISVPSAPPAPTSPPQEQQNQ